MNGIRNTEYPMPDTDEQLDFKTPKWHQLNSSDQNSRTANSRVAGCSIVVAEALLSRQLAATFVGYIRRLNLSAVFYGNVYIAQ
jgi:hypothetical protein